MKNNNKGFSLVELIVVIAIMAILAAVAVVGFSLYIPKAQQASDEQLISDIEYVLNLHAQSTPEDVTAGYIILTTGEAQASGDFVIKVLEATYGEGWSNELKLAYGEWKDNGMLDSLLSADDPQATANSVISSTFVTGNAVDSLLGDVEGLTAAAGEILLNYEDGYAAINSKLFAGSSVLDETAAALGITDTSKLTPTELSNLVVLASAKEISSNSNNENPSWSTGTSVVVQYAGLVAFASSPAVKNDTDLQKSYADLQAAIENPTPAEGQGTMDYINQKLSAFEAECGTAATKAGVDYYEVVDENMQGFVSIMDAANNANVTAADLMDENLFTQGKGYESFNNYLDTAKMISQMSTEEISLLKSAQTEGGVVITVAMNNGEFKITNTLTAE